MVKIGSIDYIRGTKEIIPKKIGIKISEIKKIKMRIGRIDVLKENLRKRLRKLEYEKIDLEERLNGINKF